MIFTCHSQAGISKTDSADELTLFFQLLANQLSQSTEEIIKRMKDDEVRIYLLCLNPDTVMLPCNECMCFQITVEDLACMNKSDLYELGVEAFSDAKLILQHARQLFRKRSGYQVNRGTEGQLAQQQCGNRCQLYVGIVYEHSFFK